MTTIAYRDDVLAGDTQVTCGTTIDGRDQKVFRKGTLLFGSIGCSGLGERFVSWVRRGMIGECPTLRPGEKDDDAWGLLFPGADLVLWRFQDRWARHRAPFFAYGSGAEFAMGAMAFGATAEEAVKVATRFDTGTGGEITVLRRGG